MSFSTTMMLRCLLDDRKWNVIQHVKITVIADLKRLSLDILDLTQKTELLNNKTDHVNLH